MGIQSKYEVHDVSDALSSFFALPNMAEQEKAYYSAELFSLFKID